MLKHAKKNKRLRRKKPKLINNKPKFEAKICEACGYQGKPSDQNPQWQCPCCQVAYIKVSKAYHQQQKQQRKQVFLKRADKRIQQAKRNRIVNNVLTGSFLGGTLFARGAGLIKACGAAAVANPWLAGVGGIILLGTLIYTLSAVGG